MNRFTDKDFAMAFCVQVTLVWTDFADGPTEFPLMQTLVIWTDSSECPWHWIISDSAVMRQLIVMWTDLMEKSMLM